MTNLEQLYGEIAREEDSLLTVGHRRALVRHRLQAGSAQYHFSMSSLLMPLAAAAALALVATGATLFWQSRNAPPITADFGDTRTSVTSGTLVTAPDTTSAPLRFSDGTQIEVAPRSRMRVVELGRDGAQLALETGRADVDVAHGDNRRWELRAGPYLVRVTGTRFDLSFYPNEDRFDLVLSEGQVELLGCGFGAGKKLVAGQSVHASCRENAVEIEYSHEPRSSAGAPVEAPPALNPAGSSSPESAPDPNKTASCPPAVTTDAGTHGPSIAVGSNSNRPDWVSLARNGKYVEALALANRAGFSAECFRIHSDELALLGDTARHAGDPAKARLAYKELRRRFAGSPNAALAAFSLGVLDFDQSRAYSSAAEWFRAYVRESPTGPLTREARGRLMEAQHRLGSSEALGLATAYLRDYPTGPHARLAQRIVSSR